jgi:hypothetical protein
MLAIHSCSWHELGQLSPATALAAEAPRCETALRLPPQVLEELRRLGMPLWAYNRGELEDAVQACAVDARLVDDPHGTSFRDKLSLTFQERLQRQRNDHHRRKTTPGWPQHDDEDDDSCRLLH